MAVRTLVNFDEQSSVTTNSDDFIVGTAKDVSVVARLVSGTPTTGARFMITLDEIEKINAGTATWIASPLGYHNVSSAERLLRPVTGVRLNVSDGTWAIQIRQI